MQILATLGPSSLEPAIVRRLDALGVDLFRLNLSHMTPAEVNNALLWLREHTGVSVCLDTHGSKDSPDDPALSISDRESLAIGRRLGVRDVALSFARRAEDVEEISKLSHPEARVIAKIECTDGLLALSDLAMAADALLIDRGDLSREVPIERIPLTQKHIIATARFFGVPVYVATNLLDTMMSNAAPSLGEANDVWNTMADGAAGLVLAGETAIGRHPVETVEMVKRMIAEFERT